MEEMLLAAASKFGPAGLVALMVGQMVWKLVKARLTPAAPDPASPIPAPTSDTKYPILDALLKGWFGRKAPTAINANPELIAKLKSEVDQLHYRQP